MPISRFLVLAGWLLCAAAAGAADSGVIRLGISHYATPNPNEALYTKTVETLRRVVAPRELSVKYYSPGELGQKAQEDGLHLIFGSAGFYRRTALETGSRGSGSRAGHAEDACLENGATGKV